MRKSLLLIVLLVAALPARAEWVRANLYGADVRALVIDPKHPDVLYLGTSEGEVYVSRDGATTWMNPWHGVPFPGYVVDNLVVDARGRLWAACWGLWGGGVVAVSSDGGATWARRDQGLDELSVRAIAVDPSEPDVLVAGGLTGVYRTTNAGKSWQKISDQENVESIAIDPRSADRIYAGTWRQAFRTEDGGKSWKLINEGMVLDTDVFSINIDAGNPDNVWLSTCGWVYSSPNRGDNWTRYKDGFNNRRIHSIELDPLTKAVYAGSVAGLYRTADEGKSWQLVTDENLVINAIGLHPDRPERIVLGTEGDGVYVSRDGGKSFTRSSTGLFNLRVAAVHADPRTRKKLYAAVVFGGGASGFYESPDGGGTWQRLNKDKLPEILTFVVRDGAGPRFVAGTEKGFYVSDDGIDWTAAQPAPLPVRIEKILAYNSTRLFAATSEGVFTSRDSGQSWYRLADSVDRTLDISLGSIGEKKSLVALTAAGMVVFTGEKWEPVADAPARGRTLAVRREKGADAIVVAGAQGVQTGTIDSGLKWHELTAPEMSHASVYQVDRAMSRSVVLASRERPDVFIGDTGMTGWRTLSLPARSVDIASVATDPFDPTRMYVATSGQGIYIWQETSRHGDEMAGRYLGGGSK